MATTTVHTDVRDIIGAIEAVKISAEGTRNYYQYQAQTTSMSDWRERYERLEEIHGAIASTLSDILNEFTERKDGRR